MPTLAISGSRDPMMATLANVGPMCGGELPVVQHWPTLPPSFTTSDQTLVNVFGDVLPVVQHWPTLPPPFTTLGRTWAHVRIANVGPNVWLHFFKKGDRLIHTHAHHLHTPPT